MKMILLDGMIIMKKHKDQFLKHNVLMRERNKMMRNMTPEQKQDYKTFTKMCLESDYSYDTEKMNNAYEEGKRKRERNERFRIRQMAEIERDRTIEKLIYNFFPEIKKKYNTGGCLCNWRYESCSNCSIREFKIFHPEKYEELIEMAEKEFRTQQQKYRENYKDDEPCFLISQD